MLLGVVGLPVFSGYVGGPLRLRTNRWIYCWICVDGTYRWICN
ncbi:MAG: hypothetical protein ACLT33_02080 [Lachnospira pectinoschiza]